jgi:hypothetical protein
MCNDTYTPLYYQPDPPDVVLLFYLFFFICSEGWELGYDKMIIGS